MRKLEIQWMVNGPGGYDNHRWTVPLPSLSSVLVLLSLVAVGCTVIMYRRELMPNG